MHKNLRWRDNQRVGHGGIGHGNPLQPLCGIDEQRFTNHYAERRRPLPFSLRRLRICRRDLGLRRFRGLNWCRRSWSRLDRRRRSRLLLLTCHSGAKQTRDRQYHSRRFTNFDFLFPPLGANRHV